MITITNNGAVIGVNADTGLLSANAYDNLGEGLAGSSDYIDTFLSLNEQPASLTIWAYAGDPATPGVARLELTGNFDDITAIDYSQSYRDSVENNPGEDWTIYTNAQLNVFFTALTTAVSPKVVITVTDLAGNVITQTIDLVVPADNTAPTLSAVTAGSVVIGDNVAATSDEAGFLYLMLYCLQWECD